MSGRWPNVYILYNAKNAQKFAVTAKPPIPPFLPDPGGSRFFYPAFPG